MAASPDNQAKFEQYRRKYPFFAFEGFETAVDPGFLKVTYHFNLSGRYEFRPVFSLPYRPFFGEKFTPAFVQSAPVQSLLFHIGMVELISYWKAACPPKVLIKPYSLNAEQVAFFKKLYFNGLGEFFYTNGIECTESGFMEIESRGTAVAPFAAGLHDKVIVPIGGGKDSVVSLELLKPHVEVKPFILNPRGASLQTVETAHFDRNQIIEINRTIDPQLLELNAEGFLNGHTPFSALLAMYCLLVSYFSGFKHMALSNESSANETTIQDSHVNHQYSKSWEFENDFRNYASRYISEDFNYFSFLRPLNELQIAKLFSEQVLYYPVFKSCNAGSKTDVWCGNCPKCLFAWIILCPFIPLDELIQIFGKNLFEDAGLLTYFKQLTGIDDVKPFECVGTVDEVNAALHLYMRQHPKQRFPLLLQYYSNSAKYQSLSDKQIKGLLQHINTQHFLNDDFFKILKEKIHA